MVSRRASIFVFNIKGILFVAICGYIKQINVGFQIL